MCALIAFKKGSRFILLLHEMCSLVGLLGDINQTHIKAVQIFKTPIHVLYILPAGLSARTTEGSAVR